VQTPLAGRDAGPTSFTVFFQVGELGVGIEDENEDEDD
jgi:hypothetical protein